MNHHDEPDTDASRALWALFFIAVGTMILANLPLQNAGWWILTAVISYVAAAWFLFLLLVGRDG